jgi:hypothetical protein
MDQSRSVRQPAPMEKVTPDNSTPNGQKIETVEKTVSFHPRA